MNRLAILLLALLSTCLPLAAAAAPTADQINVNIGTPAVMALRHSLAQRQSRLIRFYEAGIMGIVAGREFDINIPMSQNRLAIGASK